LRLLSLILIKVLTKHPERKREKGIVGSTVVQNGRSETLHPGAGGNKKINLAQRVLVAQNEKTEILFKRFRACSYNW